MFPIKCEIPQLNKGVYPPSFNWRQSSVLLVGIAWAAVIITGFTLLWNYQRTPGKIGSIPLHWPSQSRIPHPTDLPILVMMVHPHCPCTRASIGELAQLMTSLKGRLNAVVLFYKPQEFPERWEKTDLWSSAAAIPGVHPLVDDRGEEARRFGAQTSGQTLVYSTAGYLLFSGGITDSRGHMGDTIGRDAIVSLITHGHSNFTKTLVFGCSLLNPEKESPWKN